jgi:hypothetical protein
VLIADFYDEGDTLASRQTVIAKQAMIFTNSARRTFLKTWHLKIF